MTAPGLVDEPGGGRPPGPGSGRTTFTAHGDDRIVVTRRVDVPRRLVFAAWTEPAHLLHWLGKADWTMTVCESDPRPGGIRRFVWRRDDGAEMGVRGVYCTVAPPAGFSCTESFDGGPDVTVNTLSFVEHDGRTTITSTICYPSTRARDAAFTAAMRDGFGESLMRLSDHLDRDPDRHPDRATPFRSSTAGQFDERNPTWT